MRVIHRGAMRGLTLVVAFVAILYFAVDAAFLSIIRPFAVRLSQLPVFVRLAAGFARLGPYPTLALFLVPVLVLEPIKPIGLYLIGSGHVMTGALAIAIGEIVKITLVERLFHISRDKLMSIPAFAWGYGIVQRLLGVLRSQPGWRLVMKTADTAKSFVRRLRLNVQKRRVAMAARRRRRI